MKGGILRKILKEMRVPVWEKTRKRSVIHNCLSRAVSCSGAVERQFPHVECRREFRYKIPFIYACCIGICNLLRLFFSMLIPCIMS